MDNVGKPKFIDHFTAVCVISILVIVVAMIFRVPAPHWLHHLFGK